PALLVRVEEGGLRLVAVDLADLDRVLRVRRQGDGEGRERCGEDEAFQHGSSWNGDGRRRNGRRDGGKIARKRQRGRAMDHSSLAEFEAAARREGFDEVAERSWPANAAVDTHEHPFAVKAVVVAGEMWLTHDGRTLHL